jgi:uncharacterized protein (TIGR00661 family)
MDPFKTNGGVTTDDKPVKVIVTPLDWGIGHATRLVPVINYLEHAGCDIYIAGAGRPIDFLRSEFPHFKYLDLDGPEISYPSGDGLFLHLLRQTPKFLFHIFREKRNIKKYIRQFGIRLIISDNRYGCRHRDIPSVFITHQLHVQLPKSIKWFEPIVRRINYHFINQFSECWIPDFEPRKGIAGILSHPAVLPSNASYVGILSRFSLLIDYHVDAIPPSIDLLVMLSGPEPQRTIFENILMKQIPGLGLTTVIVRGVPDEDQSFAPDKFTHVFSHLKSRQLLELMARASLVICRSGYSTIMDLVTIGKKAVLVPTPGQTEQEYLASYLMEKKVYLSLKQENFDILYAVELSKNFPGMVIRNDEKELKEKINRLIRQAGGN